MCARRCARWAVDRDRARTVYLNTRTDDPEVIASKIVAPYQRQASNFVYARYDNVTAINAREKAQGEISALLNASLAAQGLRLDYVMLSGVEPDKATSDAMARYASEMLKTKIATQSVLTAEQEALRKVAEAEGTAAAAKELPDLSGTDLDVLCVQAWQEAVAAATARGVALYTHPCGGGANVLAK
jgi:regulator of protease activity HflC (stomatin/prohibitin superfamily)